MEFKENVLDPIRRVFGPEIVIRYLRGVQEMYSGSEISNDRKSKGSAITRSLLREINQVSTFFNIDIPTHNLNIHGLDTSYLNTVTGEKFLATGPLSCTGIIDQEQLFHIENIQSGVINRRKNIILSHHAPIFISTDGSPFNPYTNQYNYCNETLLTQFGDVADNIDAWLFGGGGLDLNFVLYDQYSFSNNNTGNNVTIGKPRLLGHGGFSSCKYNTTLKNSSIVYHKDGDFPEPKILPSTEWRLENQNDIGFSIISSKPYTAAASSGSSTLDQQILLRYYNIPLPKSGQHPAKLVHVEKI